MSTINVDTEFDSPVHALMREEARAAYYFGCRGIEQYMKEKYTAIVRIREGVSIYSINGVIFPDEVTASEFCFRAMCKYAA